jgi:hypothetical protein
MIKRVKKNVKRSILKKQKRKESLKLFSYFHENGDGTLEQFVTIARNWNEAIEKMAKLCQPREGDWGLHKVEEYK